MSQPGNGAEPVARVESGLVYQRCRWCGTASFRTLLCPVCASSDLDSLRSEGQGVVVRATVVHRNTAMARNESLVRLAEGFMIRCRIIGVPPHLVRAGVRVLPAPGRDPNVGESLFEVCDTNSVGRWR
ncbi:Zn-ribbon domain-containing OB-fold protein [Streptomyces gardneri]|uniref:Zn-ribbon domain-containing OB-fold protein n=1 Tax=Streptomyces gardneri TaxID=66892 RepID=UPI0036A3B1AE